MRGLKSLFRSIVVAFTVVLFAVAPISVQAQNVTDRPSGLEMVADAAVVRPLTLVSTVLGAGVFLVTLPISALGGNVGEAGNTLVATPFKSAFLRCLGCTQKHLPQSD